MKSDQTPRTARKATDTIAAAAAAKPTIAAAYLTAAYLGESLALELHATPRHGVDRQVTAHGTACVGDLEVASILNADNDTARGKTMKPVADGEFVGVHDAAVGLMPVVGGDRRILTRERSCVCIAGRSANDDDSQSTLARHRRECAKITRVKRFSFSRDRRKQHVRWRSHTTSQPQQQQPSDRQTGSRRRSWSSWMPCIGCGCRTTGRSRFQPPIGWRYRCRR